MTSLVEGILVALCHFECFGHLMAFLFCFVFEPGHGTQFRQAGSSSSVFLLPSHKASTGVKGSLTTPSFSERLQKKGHMARPRGWGRGLENAFLCCNLHFVFVSEIKAA